MGMVADKVAMEIELKICKLTAFKDIKMAL